MCIWKASIPMRFYVDFFLSLVLFVSANQAEIKHLSVFLQSVVSLLSGLGKGGLTITVHCGMRDIICICEEPRNIHVM